MTLRSKRPIFLIGFMGTGKSTVGQLLAARLGRRFVDLDAAVEAEAQMTVAELFYQEQEAGFRAREAAALRELAHKAGLVIACGGGAPAFGDNLEVMLAAGSVVCLAASVDELVARVGDVRTRPLLAGASDVRAEVERLLAARQPAYARAHVSVDTTGRPPSEVATEVVAALGKLDA